jgi:non-ribosomal peptide synthetase component F
VSSLQLAYIIHVATDRHGEGSHNEHRAVVNRRLWMQVLDPLDATDSVLQKASIGFDGALLEIFWPLMTGARLVNNHDWVGFVRCTSRAIEISRMG